MLSSDYVSSHQILETKGGSTEEHWETFIFTCYHTTVMRCAICYHLHNLKNVKNTHGGVLLSVNLQVETCNFTKSNTPPWLIFLFFELYKWYEIAQNISTSFGLRLFFQKNMGIELAIC